MKCLGRGKTSTFVTKKNGEYVLSQHLRTCTDQKVYLTDEMIRELIAYYEERQDES